MATDYLTAFLETYGDKDVILLPYHPVTESDHQGCVLISIDMLHSQATYLDSASAKRKNYSTIRTVLDGALTGYVAAGGVIRGKPVMRYGMNVFNHKMEFPCVKQPPSSGKDAFYALHHMNAFVLDQQNNTLTSDLRRWAEDLARIQDRNLRQSFFDITEEISSILHQHVIRSGGIFSGGVPGANRDIDRRLADQGDGRLFMTMARGARGGFINVSNKPTHQPKKKS
jgi:hypothetical protein